MAISIPIALFLVCALAVVDAQYYHNDNYYYQDDNIYNNNNYYYSRLGVVDKDRWGVRWKKFARCCHR